MEYRSGYVLVKIFLRIFGENIYLEVISELKNIKEYYYTF